MSQDEALHYQAGETSFAGLFVAHRSEEPSRGGILIAPDWRGLSPFVRQEADRFADAGFDAGVVDLYGDGLQATEESQSGPLIRTLIDDRGRGAALMTSCLKAFRRKLGSADSVALLGYSIGGMVSLDFARAGADVAGVVLCSALLKPAEPGAPTSVAGRVLALHGTQDVVCPIDMVEAVAEEMDRAGNDATIVLYSGTHHAFYNPEAGTDPTARLVYSSAADKRSRTMIDEFLAESLSSS